MRHIVVMKPGDSGQQLYELIKNLSPQKDFVHFWPAFTFQLPAETEAIKQQLLKANLDGSTIVVVSPNAAIMVKKIIDNWPITASMAAPGKPTANKIFELWEKNVEVLSPEGGSLPSGSESLYEEFLKVGLPKKALIARGQTGREFLYDQLVKDGVEVNKLVVYERVPLELQEIQKSWLKDLEKPPVVYLTSSDTVDILFDNLSEDQISHFQKSKFVTIHKRIASHLNDRGCCDIFLVDSTDKSIQDFILGLSTT